jgi:hypothetical protein
MNLTACIVLVADDAYLPHAKSVMVNCRRQGKWTGDFCIVMPPDAKAATPDYFKRRGVNVLTDDEPTYYRKFAIFDAFFEKWDIVLYMDCDVLVVNPLEPLLHEVQWGQVLADRELFTLRHAFTYWAKPEFLAKPETVAEFDRLWAEFSPDYQQFNTGVLVYHPRTMIPDMRAKLRAMRERLAPINTHVVKGTDQPIINLVLYNRFASIRSDMVAYWRHEWAGSIIVHTCSGYAPWIAKQPGMDAYASEVLQRPMHDLYLEHLAAFEKEFPAA